MSIEHDLAAWRLAHAHGVPFRFRGGGASMWPTLRAGDEALFVPLAGEPRRGEILLYRAGDALVAHRFIDRRGDLLRLRGDAMPDDDPPVARSAILGRLDAILRHGDRIRPSPLLAAAAVRSPRRLRLLLARIAARLTPRVARR